MSFLHALRRDLPPDMPVRWQIDAPGGEERLWIRVHVAGTPAWISCR